ncbi:MAG: UMP kinase [Candidatus Kuenenbacteria bacterium]
MSKRILIKISGELFKSDKDAIDLEKVKDVAEEIKKISKDYQLGIVFGGGNIFRGRTVKDLNLNMATAHFIGMTATLVNALAIKNIFDAINAPSRILSALNFPQVIGVSNRFDIDKYFELGEILIFAGGTGNPFVSTDTCAVIRALEIKAEFILKATNVKGIYDCDPRKNPGAIKFKDLDYATFLQLKESFVLDRTATVLAAENNLPIYVFKWEQGSLKKAIKLKSGGTLIR